MESMLHKFQPKKKQRLTNERVHALYVQVTSFDERIPELLRQDAAVVLNVNGLEDAVELELLGVHVAPELLIVDAAVPIGIADLEQVPRVLILRRDAHR